MKISAVCWTYYLSS